MNNKIISIEPDENIEYMFIEVSKFPGHKFKLRIAGSGDKETFKSILQNLVLSKDKEIIEEQERIDKFNIFKSLENTEI